MAGYYHQPPASSIGAQWPHNNHSGLPSSAVGDLMYAFPRPRKTGRIMKPRSAGNSPSAAGRRRAYQTSPQYQQPLSTQEYVLSFNPALLASAIREKRASRPISWHPASLASAEYSSPQYFPTTAADNLALLNTHQLDPTSTSYGDFNMMPSYTTSDMSTATDAFSFGDITENVSMQPPSYMQMSGSQVEPLSWDTASSNVPAMAQPMPDAWAFDMMSMQNSMPSTDIPGSSYASVPSSGCLSGPSTPDFLPIQQPEPMTKSLSEESETGDELIGMGLYNHPETFPDPSQGRPGKGLKLEETFTPSDDEGDDDDQDAESEDNKTEHGVAKESQPAQQLTKSATSMMQKSFFFEDDEPEQPTTAYQHFFNLGSQPCMSYGYGWL
ncbi:hypothetical protein BJX96DRAFT_160294 [Aspergillus floccosus]